MLQPLFCLFVSWLWMVVVVVVDISHQWIQFPAYASMKFLWALAPVHQSTTVNLGSHSNTVSYRRPCRHDNKAMLRRVRALLIVEKSQGLNFTRDLLSTFLSFFWVIVRHWPIDEVHKVRKHHSKNWKKLSHCQRFSLYVILLRMAQSLTQGGQELWQTITSSHKNSILHLL